MPEQRHVRLFRNGRNQAVRIPVEFELPGDEAIMHRDGDRLIIEPVRKRGLIALLKSMKPLDEEFPDIDDPAPERGRPLSCRFGRAPAVQKFLVPERGRDVPAWVPGSSPGMTKARWDRRSPTYGEASPLT